MISASLLRDVFRTWQEGMQENDGWNALFWNNHDQPRAISRFGGRGGAGRPDSSWEKAGRMLGICLHLMRGTPFVYQGEELGMTNPGYGSIEEFDDVESRNHYRIMIESGKSAAEALRIVNERSRDDGRSPMQWSAGENAGFTTGRPWIGVAANYPLVNAQDECASEDSMYAFYRRLIELRKKLEMVSCGAIRFLEAGSGAPKVIAYERTHDHAPAGQPKHLVAICSFDDEPCRAELSLRRDGVRECAPDGEAMAGDASIPFVIPAGAKVLAGNYSGVMFDGDAVCLRPFEALALAW